MDLRTFAKEYPRLKPVLWVQHATPNKQEIQKCINSFESSGVVVSKTGLTAEMALRWLVSQGQPFRLQYHTTYGCYIVTRVSEAEVEDTTITMATQGKV